jgi:hypothetical protein
MRLLYAISNGFITMKSTFEKGKRKMEITPEMWDAKNRQIAALFEQIDGMAETILGLETVKAGETHNRLVAEKELRDCEWYLSAIREMLRSRDARINYLERELKVAKRKAKGSVYNPSWESPIDWNPLFPPYVPVRVSHGPLRESKVVIILAK